MIDESATTRNTYDENDGKVEIVMLSSDQNNKKGASTTKRKVRKVRKVLRSEKRDREEKKTHLGDKNDQNRTWLKYVSLLLLVAQNVGLVLMMRYSRTNSTTANSSSGDIYISSTAVFMNECVKFLTCIIVVFSQYCNYDVQTFIVEMDNHVWNAPFEVLKLTVPSLLYTIQNNLLYSALSNLDAATYQVCYQLKILTTALFSAVLLQKKFTTTKWISLCILTLGVVIVQLSTTSEGGASAATLKTGQNKVLGLICVLCAACTSGFSGVYFEKILKGSQTSLWIRNIQMSLPSLLISFTTCYARDAYAIQTKGFFVGYSWVVWTVIMIQAFGGLLVAIVVKYADNVAKVFATSVSIIVSCLVSGIFFDFRPDASFCVGTLLVMVATVLYGRPVGNRPKRILPR